MRKSISLRETMVARNGTNYQPSRVTERERKRCFLLFLLSFFFFRSLSFVFTFLSIILKLMNIIFQVRNPARFARFPCEFCLPIDDGGFFHPFLCLCRRRNGIEWKWIIKIILTHTNTNTHARSCRVSSLDDNKKKYTKAYNWLLTIYCHIVVCSVLYSYWTKGGNHKKA